MNKRNSEDHVRHMLTAYISRQLSQPQEKAMLEHTWSCDGCRSTLSGYERMSQDLRLTLRKSRVMPENLIQSLWKQACLRQIRSDALSPLLRAIPVAVSLLALMIPMLSCQALSGGQPDRLSVIPSAAQEIEFVAIPIITADIENRTTTVPGAAVMPALVTATEPHPLFVANPTPLPQAPPACCPANDL